MNTILKITKVNNLFPETWSIDIQLFDIQGV